MSSSKRSIGALVVLTLGLALPIVPLRAQQEPPPPVDINAAMKQIQGALQQMNFEGKEPVHFSKLKELLCVEQIKQLARESCTGSSNKFDGVGVSTAEGVWQKDGKSVRIVFTDLAAMPAVMAAGRLGFAMGLDIDQETDTTRTKTMDLAGQRALWTWNSETGRSELQMFVLDRFGVEIDADNLGERAAIEVGEALPLTKFKTLE